MFGCCAGLGPDTVYCAQEKLISTKHWLRFRRERFIGPRTKYQSRNLLELNPLQKPRPLNYSINIIPFHLKCSQRCHFQSNARGNPSCTEGDCSDCGVASISPSTFTSFLLGPSTGVPTETQAQPPSAQVQKTSLDGMGQPLQVLMWCLKNRKVSCRARDEVSYSKGPALEWPTWYNTLTICKFLCEIPIPTVPKATALHTHLWRSGLGKRSVCNWVFSLRRRWPLQQMHTFHRLNTLWTAS